MARARILVAEDEPSLLTTLTDRLASERYEVETTTDGEDCLERAIQESFDLLLLDVMLPNRDGFEITKELRRRRIEIPILMLTARREVVDRVVGLKLGADDYLTKPFEMAELLARIDASLRRSRGADAEGETLSFGTIRIDTRAARIHRGTEELDLSALEYKLLCYLVERRGALVSRNELLDKVWGYDAMPVTRTVDVHIASLRQKIETNPGRPRHIVTVRGLGYRFVG